MIRQMNVIVDLMFGSCGKGLLAGYLGETTKPDCLVTAWAPNAGHTYISSNGVKYVHTMLANGVVSPELRTILIGPGSVIDPIALNNEIHACGLGDVTRRNVRIAIHQNAAVVRQEHRELEAAYGARIGSTMKGVGEATIAKIRRPVEGMNIAKSALRDTPLEQYVVDNTEYNKLFDSSEIVQVEGAQGFSLGINQGMYPYVTSRECTVHQTLSDCGIPNRHRHETFVYGVARTFPIRVANRYEQCRTCITVNAPHADCPTCNGTGTVQIGTSGPGYPDQEELTWEKVGQPTEYTTVTKLPRRVFSFSKQQVAEAIRMNGCDGVFLNFANYLSSRPCAPGEDNPQALWKMISDIQRHAPVVALGWGPTFNDVEQV